MFKTSSVKIQIPNKYAKNLIEMFLHEAIIFDNENNIQKYLDMLVFWWLECSQETN